MSLDLEDLNNAFQVQERRIELIENRMDKLEGTTCSSPCPDVEKLKEEIGAWKTDLSHCSSSKDEKIGALSMEVHSMKSSIDKLDGDLSVISMTVRDISSHLAKIAGTMESVKEVVDAYQTAKGGAATIQYLGKIVIGIAAALAAWWVIANTTLNVPK